MYDEKAILTNQSITSNFQFNNVHILQVTIENIIVTLKNKQAEKFINEKIKKQSNEFFIYAANKLYPTAIEDYKTRSADGFPFHGHEAILNFQNTYNNNCFLSFYSDNYQFTGGAHGLTIRTSSTFNLKTGYPVLLNVFFKGNYQNYILHEIIKQADEIMAEDPVLFEDYKKRIIKNFNPNSFYLTDNGIVIYYQQYEIAPYSTGIVEFTIPYQIPPKC